ncbi:MAG: hypothetical protein JNK05_23795 [Myxococcales bacterium]|nr:hypothetical protein [Myxococcales bacterium]
MELRRIDRRPRWLPAIVALSALVATTSVARDASAQDVRAAEEAFRRAGERYLRRDFNAAANFYEASYRSAPSWQALLGAVRAHRQSEGAYHMTRAATLSLELVERYPTQRPAMRIAQQTLTELSPQLYRVMITCDAECEVEVDGVLQTRRDFFLEPGSRTLTAHFGETLAQRRTVDARAGGTGEVGFTRPPPPPPPPRRDLPPPPPPPPPAFRFHPAVPIAAGAVGVGLLTGAAISWWADALPRGRRLIENANMGIFIPEQERAVYAAEDRTTGLLVAGSIITAFAGGAAVFTRWSFAPARPASSEQSPSTQPTTAWVVLPTPGGAVVAGQF